MKRYIYATKRPDIDYSMFDGTPFKCDTGTSFGNDFLNKKDLAYRQKYKNRTGEIVMMTPEEYYEECSKYAWGHYVSVDSLIKQRRADKEKNDKFMEMMQNGTKFDMCYIDKADHGQEGLHRMMAAGDLYGWDTEFPVLVIDIYDQQVEDARIEKDKAYDFRNEKFTKYCDWAESRLMDIDVDKAKTMDLLETYRKCILDECAYWDSSLKIDFEIDISGNTVKVWLTDYNGWDFDGYLAEPYETELSELEYKLYEYDKYWEPDLSDIVPDDLGDESVADLFFKKTSEQ